MKHFICIVALTVAALLPARAESKVDTPENGFDFSVIASQAHPRLLLDADEFKALSKEISRGKNPDLESLHAFLMKMADEGLEGAPLTYGLDKSKRRIRCGDQSRLIAFAYAYRRTRSKAYVKKAEKDMLALCSFPDWVPTHYLGTAAISTSLAFAYDWMYQALSPSIRKTVEEAIRTKGFDTIGQGRNGWWYNAKHNWNQVCNAGVSAAAIAFYETDPERCQALLRKAVTTNRPAAAFVYGPDGASPEGPGYWAYGTGNQILLNMLLEHACGTDFGLSEIPGFSNSGRYILYITGNINRSFNYSDNNAKTGIMPDLWYFARRFNQPEILFREKDRIQDASSYSSAMKDLVALINAWKMGKTGAGAPKELCFAAEGATPVFTARTGWDKRDMFLGIKGGKASTNHAHMDAGSFVFDAFSKRWSMDFDHPSYASVEYYINPMGESLFNMKQNALRWTMLAFNNRSHSTLTVNGKDHVVKGFAPMTATFTDPARMGASFDLKNVFGGDLRKAERTGAIIDGSYLEITDRLAAPDDRPARVRWTMVTPAEPEITPEGILLRQGSITMILSASGAPLTYKTWSTDPMDYDSPTKTFEPRVNGTWLVGFETELAAGQSADLVTTLKRKK